MLNLARLPSFSHQPEPRSCLQPLPPAAEGQIQLGRHSVVFAPASSLPQPTRMGSLFEDSQFNRSALLKSGHGSHRSSSSSAQVRAALFSCPWRICSGLNGCDHQHGNTSCGSGPCLSSPSDSVSTSLSNGAPMEGNARLWKLTPFFIFFK